MMAAPLITVWLFLIPPGGPGATPIEQWEKLDDFPSRSECEVYQQKLVENRNGRSFPSEAKRIADGICVESKRPAK
jgi:hypothetical protein